MLTHEDIDIDYLVHRAARRPCSQGPWAAVPSLCRTNSPLPHLVCFEPYLHDSAHVETLPQPGEYPISGWATETTTTYSSKAMCPQPQSPCSATSDGACCFLRLALPHRCKSFVRRVTKWRPGRTGYGQRFESLRCECMWQLERYGWASSWYSRV